MGARRIEDEALPAWYRTAAAASWRFLVIAAAITVVVYALVHLRVVVLPIIVALLASTLLLPLVRWLKDRNAPDALAAAVAMIAAALLVVAVATAVAPSVADQLDELRPQAEEGIREASDVLADPPFNVSDRELDQTVDEGIARLRENSGPLARGLQSGAVLLGEIVTGLIIAVLLTFFLLKDGERMWGYAIALVGQRSRHDADELGRRAYMALAGYIRGIALVGLVDAILIGIALAIIGVPLVVPLMIITFVAAFVPLIGAFSAPGGDGLALQPARLDRSTVQQQGQLQTAAAAASAKARTRPGPSPRAVSARMPPTKPMAPRRRPASRRLWRCAWSSSTRSIVSPATRDHMPMRR